MKPYKFTDFTDNSLPNSPLTRSEKSVNFFQDESSEAILTIRSIIGHKLFSETIQEGIREVELNLSGIGIGSGVYLIEIQGDGVDIREMIVKQ